MNLPSLGDDNWLREFDEPELDDLLGDALTRLRKGDLLLENDGRFWVTFREADRALHDLDHWPWSLKLREV